jgi:hypothetical protein
MLEANSLRPIDEKCGGTSNIKRRQTQPVIDSIAFNHLTVWINQDRKGHATSLAVFGHLRGTLTDDDDHLSSEAMVGWEMGLQLLQLNAATRSPGASYEDD